ncbi:uncharacterized protein LOC123228783 [Mangifera indica]|uniref:uncharacterized protein LOC123228783 n=1 Tax=Mangifera indica TaxID=29780 RepID=UPI001CFA128D|nr:uncharacterized protein LOC123228783 [Mangifera indica]
MLTADLEADYSPLTSSHQKSPVAETDITRKRRINLYRAALRGDCRYEIHPDDITAKISEREDTALHIGALVNSSEFAIKLLLKLDKLEDLVVKNNSGNTPFCLAAASGELKLAKKMIQVAERMVNEKKYGNLEIAMIKENKYEKLEEVEMMKHNGQNLARVKGFDDTSPLLFAVFFGREEMVYWLYNLTKTSLEHDDRIKLLLALIRNGFHELALQLVEEDTKLATAYDENNKQTALHALVELPFANQQGVWNRIKRCIKRYHTLQLLDKYKESESPNQQGGWEKIKKCFKRVLCSIEKMSPEMKLVQHVWKLAVSGHDFDHHSSALETARKLVFVAAERGNIEFLKILIREYPDLIFQVDDNDYSIFHFAVKYRHEEIFRLVHEIGSAKDFLVSKKDKGDNNILHLAGMLAPSERLHSVSGAALQMQRELLWFEEVKKLLYPSDVQAKNNGNSLVGNNNDGKSTQKEDGKSPRALFSDEHKELKQKGEKWMKDTANYCMVVAALITTMVFAIALAVPGGTNAETGSPKFLDKISFKIFIVSDAISLVLSTCSILTFLSILTSRYAEEDFLEPLPRKLIVGLSTLWLSIAAMMIVFCAAIFILFKDGVLWIPILVTAIGSLPIIFFIKQQVWLFIDVLCSTYTSSSIFKPRKGTLLFE